MSPHTQPYYHPANAFLQRKDRDSTPVSSDYVSPKVRHEKAMRLLAAIIARADEGDGVA